MDDLFSYAARKAEERAQSAQSTKPAEQSPPLRQPAPKPAAPPQREPEQPLTVTQLNGRARGLLEGTIGTVAVVGELSGCKLGRGGHWYFALKDAHSQLPAVMFRREARHLK
ncbi:MAG: exodeoxyribonuclease VII large subunit, partial [Myxococcota bacterium]